MANSELTTVLTQVQSNNNWSIDKRGWSMARAEMLTQGKGVEQRPRRSEEGLEKLVVTSAYYNSRSSSAGSSQCLFHRGKCSKCQWREEILIERCLRIADIFSRGEKCSISHTFSPPNVVYVWFISFLVPFHLYLNVCTFLLPSPHLSRSKPPHPKNRRAKNWINRSFIFSSR